MGMVRRWFVTLAASVALAALGWSLTFPGGVLAGAPGDASAAGSPVAGRETIDALRQQLQRAREQFHRGGPQAAPALDDLRALADRLHEAALSASSRGDAEGEGEALSDEAIALLELVNVTEGQGPNAEAYALLERAERAALRAVEIAPRQSEAHRLLGEVSMRLLAYRGSAALSLVSRTQRELEMAIRLDAGNPAAFLAMAQFEWGAPAGLGGGPARGLQLVEQALKVARTDLDRYLAYVWQGNLLQKMGRSQAAREAYARALAIYPDGGMARQFRQAAEKGNAG
ncbi:hypothetical protein U7230_14285 [Carboxydochorda subterranea]|uniref:Tetratricopeptide repeat protein n=1 Tax=Carboxydichorda subterranea TaxID=3109565 RepID=A0ABZ1BWQ4_9FIRM|nr:hypothetical protein [Limnochorda sp. L945t]WRP17230.1 hypothetical protein U7230_14285 [Limnochorda sp. L945t]